MEIKSPHILDGAHSYSIDYKSCFQGYTFYSNSSADVVPYTVTLYEGLSNTFAISNNAFLYLDGAKT